jgi:hypothetical protein
LIDILSFAYGGVLVANKLIDLICAPVVRVQVGLQLPPLALDRIGMGAGVWVEEADGVIYG